jgi:hypothetical protein
MCGWRVVVHSARAALMSGRSCALAASVFLEAVAIADETAGERGGIGACAGCRGKFSREFRHCDVGFLFNAGDEERFVRIAPGVAPPAAGFGVQASCGLKSLHRPDNERNRHAEMRGSGMP